MSHHHSSALCRRQVGGTGYRKRYSDGREEGGLKETMQRERWKEKN